MSGLRLAAESLIDALEEVLEDLRDCQESNVESGHCHEIDDVNDLLDDFKEIEDRIERVSARAEAADFRIEKELSRRIDGFAKEQRSSINAIEDLLLESGHRKCLCGRAEAGFVKAVRWLGAKVGFGG